MAQTINEAIQERLAEFPEDIANLALSAIELSETLPEESVAEQLENAVRRVVRERSANRDS